MSVCWCACIPMSREMGISALVCEGATINKTAFVSPFLSLRSFRCKISVLRIACCVFRNDFLTYTTRKTGKNKPVFVVCKLMKLPYRE